MGPATATTRSLGNTLGKEIAPTVFPYGPNWEGKCTPYAPAYNTANSGGACPPPLDLGTLPRSTLFATQTPPERREPFGQRLPLTFELRAHSARYQPSGSTIDVVVGNNEPLGRVLDRAIGRAYASGALVGSSNRILAVVGPSGKLLKVGSGLTLYDQSPPVPPGSKLILVLKG